MQTARLVRVPVFPIALAAACTIAGAPEPPEPAPAPCIADSECGPGRRCAQGFCADGACAKHADCASGSCDLLFGACNPPPDGGPPDAGPAPSACADKYGCPAGQICELLVCVDPAGDGHCVGDADCPRGKLCVNDQCAAGCADERDCEGSTDGAVCDARVSPTYRCQRCHPADNPCPGGQACVDQACVPARSCATPDSCTDLGLACSAQGVCGNCTSDGASETRCSAGFTCRAAHCEVAVLCGDDTICRQRFTRGYCDTTQVPAVCAVGECNDSDDCLASDVCNTQYHTCLPSITATQSESGGTADDHCDSHTDCALGYVCVRDVQGGATYCMQACGPPTCGCAGGWEVICWDGDYSGYVTEPAQLMDTCSTFDPYHEARPGFCY